MGHTEDMSKALVKRNSKSSGVVPGVAGAVIPGLGQLLNGETDKAIGMAAVWGVALVAAPVFGWLAGALAFSMHVVGGVDGYVQGRKK